MMTALKARLRPYSCPFEVLIPFVPDGSHVLDVGCGAGYLLVLLASFQTSISGLGIDESSTAIDAANRMLQRLNESGSRCTLNFSHVRGMDEWPREQFDVVMLVDVIHHVPPSLHKVFLQEAASRVRPGGVLLYKDMCLRPLWRRTANKLHDLLLAREWIHELSSQAAVRILVQSGFEVCHAETIHRLWYGHELLVFRRTATSP